jgi:hypothetical protein
MTASRVECDVRRIAECFLAVSRSFQMPRWLMESTPEEGSSHSITFGNPKIDIARHSLLFIPPDKFFVSVVRFTTISSVVRIHVI